jgi:hypothetical protein
VQLELLDEPFHVRTLGSGGVLIQSRIGVSDLIKINSCPDKGSMCLRAQKEDIYIFQIENIMN